MTMNLLIPIIEKEIDISDDYFISIYVENVDCFYNIVESFNNYSNDLLDKNILYTMGKPIKGSESVDFIPSIFNLDFTSKKTTNALYKRLYSTCVTDPEFSNSLTQINTEISTLFQNKFIDIDIPLSFDYEIAISEYLKMLNVQIELNYTNKVEKLITYMKIVSQLRNISIFLTINLEKYYTKEDLSIVAKEIGYQKIKIINIESGFAPDNSLIGLKKYIVDKDLSLLL